MLHDLKVMFLAWQQALSDKCSTELWKMSFFAITWSIWLMRNGIMFNGDVFDFEKIIDITKYRLASWFKAKWLDSPHSISDIIKFPKDISNSKEKIAVKRNFTWEPSPTEFMKFNVDGSARGKPGAVGIGGVLRDCNAAVKMIFSKSIGVVDSNMAELLVVREALKMFTASQWAPSHRLVIESDSSNVVNRMRNPNGAPWAMKRFMAQMEYFKQQLLSCDFASIPREGNNLADALAKSGVSRQHDLIILYV